jgi:thymidine kinase
MSVHLIIGPMFSGKTTRLINIYRQYSLLNKKIFLCKPKIDTRYSSKQQFVTHDQLTVPCTTIHDVSELYSNQEYMNSDIILIEEAQFFLEFNDFIRSQKHKHFYITSLNGDCHQNNFGDIHLLLSYCDSIEFLTAFCIQCGDGTKAIFTHKKTNDLNIIDIGESDKYIPVCRKHCINS